ncbi:uncharacterized protein SCODWIG_01159 [Saccharomycodes ludwigii]|uniref:C2H2-type domain-containing protein n=1 Tax=Saccharomycodes ludwigii TaxID=36035 RepID=A0A376B3Y7_9ASCO|nr:hypothetical protein SCDLUD_005285 [Saccharomycodes ludwigii]KAH3898938.1 hypothetical protein SCDLUD_005285 [Saccharomycodes ludwigii]SSD59398.1 uncharacterized protein SCODWIG_01159 [Saccharomycodes ludwigii]
MSDFSKQMNKKLKSSRPSKLIYYCQLCEKQCRDENGFKQHNRSAHHLKMKAKLTPKDIEAFNKNFELDFLTFLRLSHGEKWINANKAYNSYILNNKDHIHMNSTRFTSLTKFIKYLGTKGKIIVKREEEDNISVADGKEDVYYDADEREEINCNRLLIRYIDNSIENVQRRQKLEKLQNSIISEEESRQELLRRQMLKSKNADTMDPDEEKQTNDKEPNRTNTKSFHLSLNTGGNNKISKKKKLKRITF